DAVHPVIVRDEVAARPAQLGDIQILDGVHHIAAIAVRIGERRPFLEDAAVNAPSQMLDEVSVDFWIDLSDYALGINLDARAKWAFLRADGEGNGDQSRRQAFRKAAPGDFRVASQCRVFWGRLFQSHFLVSSD